jgi:Domain of unknown function (DUF4190)
VSDVSQGPGWWLASDGKWYSPEQKPGPVTPDLPPMGAPGAGSFVPGAGPSAGPDSPPTSPGYGPPAGAPGYYPPTAPPGYGPPPVASGYAYPAAGVPYGYAPEKTNGLAIAGFVCSLFFWVYGVGALLGIIFGFIARSQIKRSGNTQKGSGFALAGIIIGFVGIAIGIIFIIVLVAVVHHCDQNANGFCTNNTINFGNN